MLVIEFHLLAGNPIDQLLKGRSVFRVGSLDYHGNGSLLLRRVFKNSKGLARPVDFSARDIPAETAGVAQTLRFSQVSFASPQRLLGVAALAPLRGFPS